MSAPVAHSAVICATDSVSFVPKGRKPGVRLLQVDYLEVY